MQHTATASPAPDPRWRPRFSTGLVEIVAQHLEQDPAARNAVYELVRQSDDRARLLNPHARVYGASLDLEASFVDWLLALPDDHRLRHEVYEDIVATETWGQLCTALVERRLMPSPPSMN